jgi:hypothetical protein
MGLFCFFYKKIKLKNSQIFVIIPANFNVTTTRFLSSFSHLPNFSLPSFLSLACNKNDAKILTAFESHFSPRKPQPHFTFKPPFTSSLPLHLPFSRTTQLSIQQTNAFNHQSTVDSGS